MKSQIVAFLVILLSVYVIGSSLQIQSALGQVRNPCEIHPQLCAPLLPLCKAHPEICRPVIFIIPRNFSAPGGIPIGDLLSLRSNESALVSNTPYGIIITEVPTNKVLSQDILRSMNNTAMANSTQ
jgi:hypothetical protein